MSSSTFTLTGNSSKLSCNIFPEVVLDERYEYSCALLELTTYHSIPNVNDSNRTFYFYAREDGDGKYHKISTFGKEGSARHLKTIKVPVGCYEAHEILDYIKRYMNSFDFSFEYEVDKNTFKLRFKCDSVVYLGPDHSDNVLRKIFGFDRWGAAGQRAMLPVNTVAESIDVIKIANQDVVRVECNIVSGTYLNGKRSHTIYEFATQKIDAGYKIIEVPRNLIYLPVAANRLDYIEITLVDQNGEPIDFRGETITCRIHLKRH